MIHSKVINIIVDPDLLICIHSLKTLRSRVMPNTPYTSITHTSMFQLHEQCANHQFRENTTNRRPFSLVSNALSLAATSSTNRVSQSVSHCHHCKRISDICSSQPERRSVTKNTHTHTLLPFAEWTACYCGYLQPSRRAAASESVRFPRQKRPARADVSAVPSPDFFRTPERTRTDDESKDVFFFFFFLGRSHEKKKNSLGNISFVLFPDGDWPAVVIQVRRRYRLPPARAEPRRTLSVWATERNPSSPSPLPQRLTGRCRDIWINICNCFFRVFFMPHNLAREIIFRTRRRRSNQWGLSLERGLVFARCPFCEPFCADRVAFLVSRPHGLPFFFLSK